MIESNTQTEGVGGQVHKMNKICHDGSLRTDSIPNLKTMHSLTLFLKELRDFHNYVFFCKLI